MRIVTRSEFKKWQPLPSLCREEKRGNPPPHSVAERGACRLVVRVTGAQRSLISATGATDPKPDPRRRAQDSDSHD